MCYALDLFEPDKVSNLEVLNEEIHRISLGLMKVIKICRRCLYREALISRVTPGLRNANTIHNVP